MHDTPTKLLRQRDPCSGQVATEASIGLAMMVFTWIMIVYSLFLATNYLRTAMAARHVAWLKGQGAQEATPAQIDGWFFYQAGLSKVTYGPGLGISDLLSSFGGVGGGTAISAPQLSGSDQGPFLATVTFGVDDLNSTTQFPFVLLQTHVPFMPDSMLASAASVNSSCQWDETGNTWESWGDALQGIKGSLTSIVSKFF